MKCRVISAAGGKAAQAWAEQSPASAAPPGFLAWRNAALGSEAWPVSSKLRGSVVCFQSLFCIFLTSHDLRALRKQFLVQPSGGSMQGEPYICPQSELWGLEMRCCLSRQLTLWMQQLERVLSAPFSLCYQLLVLGTHLCRLVLHLATGCLSHFTSPEQAFFLFSSLPFLLKLSQIPGSFVPRHVLYLMGGSAYQPAVVIITYQQSFSSLLPFLHSSLSQ